MLTDNYYSEFNKEEYEKLDDTGRANFLIKNKIFELCKDKKEKSQFSQFVPNFPDGFIYERNYYCLSQNFTDEIVHKIKWIDDYFQLAHKYDFINNFSIKVINTYYIFEIFSLANLYKFHKDVQECLPVWVSFHPL